MDVLSDILRLLSLRASVFFHSDFCGSWAVDTSGTYRSTFHLIARGTCWLHLPEQDAPLPLRGGDLVVFPRDARHTLSDSPTPGVARSPAAVSEDRDQEGPSTSLVCGYFEFDSPQANPVLDALPDIVHIKSEDTANATWLDAVMRILISETGSDAPGADAVVDKLSEVLFIHVVRSHIQRSGTRYGLLAALADPQISRAITAVHAEPGFSWGVVSLADKAGMSRSAFARRFQQVAGMTPMQYVTHWRMQRAFEVLRSGNNSVAAIAEQSGYQTEAAFRKAFRKHTGVGPGAVRRGQFTLPP